jgi:solute carrier family 35, member E3
MPEERANSFSSSSAETATHEENEKLARLDHTEEGNFEKLKTPEELEIEEEGEDDGLLPKEPEKEEPPKSTFASSLTWMVINTLATIGIVRIGLLPSHLSFLADLKCCRRFSRTRPSSPTRR